MRLEELAVILCHCFVLVYNDPCFWLESCVCIVVLYGFDSVKRIVCKSHLLVNQFMLAALYGFDSVQRTAS